MLLLLGRVALRARFWALTSSGRHCREAGVVRAALCGSSRNGYTAFSRRVPAAAGSCRLAVDGLRGNHHVLARRPAGVGRVGVEETALAGENG